ncbi:unnamed protein product [Ilex paraguariensis]|uniref:Uncharacterized protein n=1 Tax=Ilex paraguariensis TaxID=185542 RepID=A0ABC8RJ08_9AQUA
MLPTSIRCNTCGNYIYKETKFNSRKENVIVENKKRKRDIEEMGDLMKSLENRTLDSKRGMDILAALDELKSMKLRHAVVSVDAMLEVLNQEEKEKELEEEDESLIIFRGSKVV